MTSRLMKGVLMRKLIKRKEKLKVVNRTSYIKRDRRVSDCCELTASRYKGGRGYVPVRQCVAAAWKTWC